ncbi:type VI secretion protein [Streptomyces sp. NPDC048387]|uniref:type VI secretion protein n=1 Tax=Streptomyces sp. NPDC048387 TaxID=3365542 RepID=UPI00371CDBE9
MHDPRGTEPRARGGGIPDGVLVGLLAFLLGLAVLVWSATGLAALFSKGAWPATVTFTRTPGAVRALITQPHDIPAAWPDTDPAALSGWGLFWGLFISQLLVLLVLTIFTLGVVTRAKARRTRTKPGARTPGPDTGADLSQAPAPSRAADGTPASHAHPAPDTSESPAPRPAGPASAAAPRSEATHPASANATATPPTTPPAPRPAPATERDTSRPAVRASTPAAATYAETPTPPLPAPTPDRTTGGPSTPYGAPPGDQPGRQDSATPPRTPYRAAPAAPAAQDAYRYGFGYAPPARTTPAPQAEPDHTAPAPQGHRLAYAPPAERHRLAVEAVSVAEGAVLVVTSSPALWQDTKDARAKLGPVLLYDPSHLCDTPARMHWNPADGCAERDTAAARAIALLAPVRPQARLDAAVADTAETLLRSWLQAAALDGLPFKQLARWAQGNGSQEPVRILRTHPQAAPGAAGELESALIAHPDRREQAQYLTARALSCLTSVHIREACNPNRTDALTLASFAAEGGTLYVVGEPLEDPRTRPGAMPLLTALASHVVEHGRRMAARSSHGRLDPPMTLVLEDVAAVAPVPQLPDLLTDETLPLLALCRSREQARARWPEWPAL